MTSTASKVVIDWIVAVEVAAQPAAQPTTAPAPQLPAPDVSRLYQTDVWIEAGRRFARPFYLSLEQRREIAAELDERDDRQRAAYLKLYGHVNERDNDFGYGPMSLCAPGRGDTMTGRG